MSVGLSCGKRMIVAITAVWLGSGNALPVASAEAPASDVVGQWLVRAEKERVLAVATAEVSEAKARQLKALHEQGYAGWAEWASARSDSVRDAARSASAERFEKWLRAEIEPSTRDPLELNRASADSVSRLELSLPGSRAVLGWVQPDRLNGVERDPVLELLRRRSELLAGDDSEVAVARRRATLFEGRVQNVSRLPSAGVVECEAAEVQLRLATARLAVAEAARQQLRSDHAALVSTIQSRGSRVETRSITNEETRRAATFAVRRRAIEVLALEAQSGGEIETARAARQLARLHAAGSDALHDRRQISNRDWQRAQSELRRSLLGWEQLTALKDWQGRWEYQLRRDETSVGEVFEAGVPREAVTTTGGVAGTAGGEPGDPLTMTQRREASRTRKAIALMRQWYEAVAEVEAARAERDWRDAVVSRLRAQQAPNEREVGVASSAAALCDGRVRLAGEHMQLIALLWRQEATADADDGAVAYELSLIGDVEASAILDLAARRLAREDSSAWTEQIAAAGRRVEGLRQLRVIGHASAEELARAELELTETRGEQMAAGRRQQLAEVERELTERLLAVGRAAMRDAETDRESVEHEPISASRPQRDR